MKNKERVVLGSAISDAGYTVKKFASSGGKKKLIWECPFYRTWRAVLCRSLSPKWRERYSSYEGCEVCQEWLRFSNFKRWMERQDWEGRQIDKDILIPGNKLYSPDTCVFVSQQLNKFLTDSKAARGEWPIGVCWYSRYGKFMAQCKNPVSRKNETLGYFNTPEEAHEAWRKRKHAFACAYADQQTDPRIAEALRARYLREVSHGV